MEALTTTVCPQCHKQFSYYRSAYPNGKIHCSRKCRHLAVTATTICPQCGKSFTYHKCWPRKFCSNKCSAAVNAAVNSGMTKLAPVNCEVCGKEITDPKWSGRRFCSRACFGKHLAISRKGIPRPEVRGERPDLQTRVSKKCPVCHKVFKVRKSHANRARFCSKQCMAKWQSENIRGEKSNHWRGGYEPYYGENWRPQRRNARHRDNYTCQRCGKTENELGRQLDVHHIKPFRTFGIKHYRSANRLANLISLCKICHARMDNR